MTREISNQDAQYAIELVKQICTRVGPGTPGTPQEAARAAMIRDEFASHLGEENVTTEEFDVAPWECLNGYPFSAIFLLMAALLNLSTGRFPGISPRLITAASLIFSILAPLTFILLFVFNLELFGPRFRKKKSENVIAVLRRPGKAAASRVLMMSGHHDSAPENTWLRFTGSGFILLSAAWMIGFVVMLVLSGLQLAGAIAGNAGLLRAGRLGWVLLAFPILPAVLFGLFFNRRLKNGGSVPGAADNLSGCALAAAMCRFLVNNPACIPEDTEIHFISFGSEEAGLKGSRRYVECHLDELRRRDARLLNFETVVQPGINILSSDINGTVRNSPEMVQSVAAAAGRAGVPYTIKPAFLGAISDAAPFSQAGLQALTLLPFSIPEHMIAFYHTNRDAPDVLTEKPFLHVLKLSLEWVHCRGE